MNVGMASGTSTRKPARVTRVRPAGQRHQVLTIEGGSRGYRKKPCKDCPWRKDATGVFPAEAFKHSARTAYDMSTHSFACHQTGKDRPTTCAGFLLRGAAHNLSVRLRILKGDVKYDVDDGGHDLHEDYRAMAIANGVDENDPSLAPCRGND